MDLSVRADNTQPLLHTSTTAQTSSTRLKKVGAVAAIIALLVTPILDSLSWLCYLVRCGFGTESMIQESNKTVKENQINRGVVIPIPKPKLLIQQAFPITSNTVDYIREGFNKSVAICRQIQEIKAEDRGIEAANLTQAEKFEKRLPLLDRCIQIYGEDSADIKTLKSKLRTAATALGIPHPPQLADTSPEVATSGGDLIIKTQQAWARWEALEGEVASLPIEERCRRQAAYRGEIILLLGANSDVPNEMAKRSALKNNPRAPTHVSTQRQSAPKPLSYKAPTPLSPIPEETGHEGGGSNLRRPTNSLWQGLEEYRQSIHLELASQALQRITGTKLDPHLPSEDILSNIQREDDSRGDEFTTTVGGVVERPQLQESNCTNWDYKEGDDNAEVLGGPCADRGAEAILAQIAPRAASPKYVATAADRGFVGDAQL